MAIPSRAGSEANPSGPGAGIDGHQLKERVDEILHRHPAVGLAVGVVRDGRLEAFYGHGVAGIASNAPITEDTVFRIASITKTFTAIAVMQLCEQGLVDLDAPANGYLRAFRLVPATAASGPATVRHLLTHTAGVPQSVHPSRVLRSGWFGESFELGRPMPSLAEYYQGRLRLAVQPGTTFTYTDHGFATLGQIVEDVTGTPLDRYFRERIFRPLGMDATDLARSERVTSHLATGHIMRAGGPRPVTDRQWMTSAASSAYSSPRDMARYLAALLGGGRNEHGSVLERETLARMFEPHYRTDPRVPGFGLGFFRVRCDEHLVVEHQGILPGFNSQIFLAPDDGVGVMAFTNGAHQAMMWLAAETERLLRTSIGVPEEVVRDDLAHHPEIWSGLCGWYRPRAQRTDVQVWSMLGAGVEVFVRRGRLTLRVLSPIPALARGLPLHPDDDDDPFVFRIDLSGFGLGSMRLVFAPDPPPTRLHLEVMPLMLEQRPAALNPRWWATGALALGATAFAVRRCRAARSRGKT